MKPEVIADVARKLIGPVAPVGSTHSDIARLENLKTMIAVTDYLLGDIEQVASNTTRPEYSMKNAGETAAAFLALLSLEEDDDEN